MQQANKSISQLKRELRNMKTGFYYNKNGLRKETIEVCNYETGQIKTFELAEEFNWYDEHEVKKGTPEAERFNRFDREEYYYCKGNGYTNPAMLIDSIEEEIQRRVNEELRKRGIEQ
jgi:hypothetical protein